MRAGQLAVLALLAACTTAQEESGPPAGETTVVQPVRATPAPAPTPTRPEAFTFEGELTQGGWIRGQVPWGTRSAMLGERAIAFDAEGRFFAGFDRDEPRSVVLVATLADGRTIRSPISVSPRDWQIERVDVAKRPSGSDEEWWAQREPEWTAIQEARAKDTRATGWRQQFAWPVQGRISGRFGRQRIYRGEPGSYHSGLDIAPGNGVPFAAPADGVVVLARNGFSLEGNIIIIDHGQGLNSAFLHASSILVKEGDEVRQGQQIGRVGASGRATGPHLHWSLMWADARLDPLLFVDPEA